MFKLGGSTLLLKKNDILCSIFNTFMFKEHPEPSTRPNSESVQIQMECLLNGVEQTYTKESDQPMVKNFISYTKGFWKGLFTCYDHPHLPRTNNDHERFFRKTKTRHRRMTGLRSWNEYIIRSGEFVVFVDDALRQKDLLERLQSVSTIAAAR